MKLAISNIGWTIEQDEAVYCMMKEYGFQGLEIAPTRIFPEAPYDKLKEAQSFAENLNRKHGFVIPSMQSIWFGRQEKLFGSEEERDSLVEYTKKAVHFAVAIQCKNLVFGCPKNKVIPDGTAPETGVQFFKMIGDYAAEKGTVIGMEANPAIYNTNYINDTVSALQLIERVGSEGFKLNLDVGTMIQNGESVEELKGRVRDINHVHISEPGLEPIEKKDLHGQLRDILLAEDYRGYISIEMGKVDNLRFIETALGYVKEVFG